MKTLETAELTLSQLVKLVEELNIHGFLAAIKEIEFEELNSEFKSIKLSGNQLTNQFKIDLHSFLSVLKQNENLSKANFCLIEQNGNLSLMLHFSENEAEIDLKNDHLFMLKPIHKELFEFVEIENEKYDELKKNYETGLGSSIAKVTGIANTQIICFEMVDVKKYFEKLIEELTADNAEKIKHLQFDMIQFKEIKDSKHSDYYKKNKTKISLAVCAVYDTKSTSGKKSASYNFGNLNP